MFIDPNSTFDAIILYKKKGHSFVALTEKDVVKQNLTPEQKEDFKELKVKMRILTWGMHNELNDRAMIEVNGTRQYSVKVFKEFKLYKILAEWNAKDEKGNAVPINMQTISNLDPVIAETLLWAYEIYSSSEQDEGNF